MSKLVVDQKSIKDLFSDKKADFLIPDYQRPYAWEETECQTLWDDIFLFSFPENDCDKFNQASDEYFLGPIVTFQNENGKREVIDGQQRLTTLMLLLRAFFARFGKMGDEKAIKTRQLISQCIWKTDEFGEPDMTALKIDSEVATDKDKDEFLDILRTGIAPETYKSSYASNYRFFQKKIQEFLNEYPSWFSFLPIRLLNNCILLPIEAESQDTALRIFSTLNDRGKPLSDADIFKAQFYKYYNMKGEKEDFIQKWKDLDILCNSIFHPISGTPMDELFTRYMYFERAKLGIRSSTTEALRKFYERGNYALLKKDETLENLIRLANFWNDVQIQSTDRFSERVLRRLFVLNYAPNGMWTYILSVYYMANKDDNDMLDDDTLYAFLGRIIAFIWAYAVIRPGVNTLRTPLFAEMINIVNGHPVTFGDFPFHETQAKNAFLNYSFSNNRAVTKSMLTWWAYQNPNQELMRLETALEIEHIYARNRWSKEGGLSEPRNIEALGNKALLEKRINIRASDYRFQDKVAYYKGFVTTKGVAKGGTKICELTELAESTTDFTESDIVKRNEQIIMSFIEYMSDNGLSFQD